MATTTSPTPPLKDRLQTLLSEYGPVAFAVYFSIFAAVLFGFYTAIKLGVHVENAVGTASTLGAAWVATKLTQPVRIIATLALTPLVVRVLRRGKNQSAPRPPETR